MIDWNLWLMQEFGCFDGSSTWYISSWFIEMDLNRCLYLALDSLANVRATSNMFHLEAVLISYIILSR